MRVSPITQALQFNKGAPGANFGLSLSLTEFLSPQIVVAPTWHHHVSTCLQLLLYCPVNPLLTCLARFLGRIPPVSRQDLGFTTEARHRGGKHTHTRTYYGDERPKLSQRQLQALVSHRAGCCRWRHKGQASIVEKQVIFRPTFARA